MLSVCLFVVCIADAETVADSGIDVARWNRELAVLDDPSRIFFGLMNVTVIATKP